MAKRKRAAKKRISDARQKQLEECIARVLPRVEALIDGKPELKKKLVADGLYREEMSEE